MVDHREFEGTFDDLICLGESSLDIALFQVILETEILWGKGMDLRCPLGQGLLNRNDARELLVFDMDLTQGLQGC